VNTPYRLVKKYSAIKAGGASLLALFLTVFASLFADVVPAFAQVTSFSCEKGRPLSASDASKLVQAVQSSYSNVTASTGKFTQESYLAALDTSEVSSGEMWFQKPGKMRWSYKEPRAQEVVVADNTMWVYQIDKRQVMVDSIQAALLSDLPIAFLMGLGDLSRDFEVKGGCRTSKGVVLSLIPRPKASGSAVADGTNPAESELSGFDLLVDEGAALPKGAMVTALGGNVTAIVFEKLKSEGITPPSGTFVLEYPNGVDVVDRRVP
jgi:outer membrane lipoprotein-sorting protein